MSNTRRASANDREFHQERYMSSAEVPRGLFANCVASRVRALTDPLHRKLVWWLQAESWKRGSLDAIAEEILTRWPERFATPAMAALGFGKGRVYQADEVRQVRAEIPQHLVLNDEEFPLRGELLGSERMSEDRGRLWGATDDAAEARSHAEILANKRRAAARPASYPARVFAERCLNAGKAGLGKFLFERLCLDPAVMLGRETLWYLPSLVETLTELHDLHASAGAPASHRTEIGSMVEDALEYALAERCLVIVDGLARTGKTFAVKRWCEAHRGEVRYVQVPSSNDDMSFFRAVGDALGLPTGQAFKAHELRARIEEVMHGGDLLLALDEGHYLWPQRNMRKAVPHRINWMLTQLVNMGVPVAIVTTPQFTKSQENLVRHGGWSSEQFIGRIGHYQRLPDLLSEADLEGVARHWLPGACAKSIRVLVTYAQSSEKYLQGIESLARRARFNARKANRETPSLQDVAAALKEGVVPSDNALGAALAGAQPPSRRTKRNRPAAEPFQTGCTPSARAMQPLRPDVILPARATGGSVLTS